MEDAHKLTCFSGKIERSGGERREGGRRAGVEERPAEWRSGQRAGGEPTRWNRGGALEQRPTTVPTDRGDTESPRQRQESRRTRRDERAKANECGAARRSGMREG